RAQAPPCGGYVLDRSTAGLRLATPRQFPVGALLTVRADSAPAEVPWVQVQVRSCTPVGDHYQVGCSFLEQPPWNVLLLFGCRRARRSLPPPPATKSILRPRYRVLRTPPPPTRSVHDQNPAPGRRLAGGRPGRRARGRRRQEGRQEPGGQERHGGRRGHGQG